MSPIVVWSIIVVLVMAVVYYVRRLSSGRDEDGSRYDPGLAILEFGRAFPNEAIRSLHVTADGGAIFVRLHGNKAGFMKSHRNHFACHLIHPGRVQVQPLTSAKGFTVEFLDSPTQSGTYVFDTEKEAAEVSLWLLDNYVAIAERDEEEGAPAVGLSSDPAS
ncbi:hypothetical protein [Neorhizobium sp. SOG26]|uniref:hypothetical protein n=1 Tax=Neorhizobium sp. SOG26 TaxID=2060726 RepID=UPI0026A419AF